MLKRKDAEAKKIYLFENGTKRFYEELDVTSLIKSVRMSKVLNHINLTQRQRMLLSMQRIQVISSDGSDAGGDTFGKEVQDMGHPDPGVKLFALGEVMRILKSYTSTREPITALDKKLIKGFYTTDAWELENDQLQAAESPTKVAANKALIYDIKQPDQASSKVEDLSLSALLG